MGKTTLLRRIAIAIKDEPDLNEKWLALTFPEEQYNIVNPRDFWANCFDSLIDVLEKSGAVKEAKKLDEQIESGTSDDSQGKQTLQMLIDASKRLGKRLVLLIDNIDLVLDRLKDHHWDIRETLQSEPQLLVIGASCQAMEATYKL